jgi:hypothetical protein
MILIKNKKPDTFNYQKLIYTRHFSSLPKTIKGGKRSNKKERDFKVHQEKKKELRIIWRERTWKKPFHKTIPEEQKEPIQKRTNPKMTIQDKEEWKTQTLNPSDNNETSLLMAFINDEGEEIWINQKATLSTDMAIEELKKQK